MLEIQDPESGKIFILDTRKQKELNILLKKHLIEQKNLFDKHKMDLLDLTVGHPFVNDLIKFFHSRIRRQI